MSSTHNASRRKITIPGQDKKTEFRAPRNGGKDVKRCMAKKKSGGHCSFVAGWGTDHPGFGRCRIHGGSTPNHQKAAIKHEATSFYGAPKDMEPIQALLWMIRISAGEVEYLSSKIAEIKPHEELEDTIIGKQVNIWIRERHNAMDRLAAHSASAIKLGLAERAVRVSEMYGEMLYRLLSRIFDELHLTPEQKAQAPEVIRGALVSIQGSYDVEGLAEQAEEVDAKVVA